MTEAEGFVVQGNKKAWRKHALRGIATGGVAANLVSLIGLYHRAHFHQSAPFSVTEAAVIYAILSLWAVMEITMACLLGWITAGNAPLISVNRDGVFIKTVGYRPCRIPWDEVKSIYLGNAFSFKLFEWQDLRSVVVLPQRPASLYRHLTAWERRWLFGSASLSVPQRAGWVGVSGVVMEIPPDEFMRRLNDYYQKHAWRPGLPGGPYPIHAAISAEPSRLLSITPDAGNVEQSRDVFHQTRVLNSGKTQRRALHRTLGHNRAGNRRRMPNNYRAERLPAMLNQETQTKPEPKTAATVASDTDSRVTPDELTAAIEAIERRKAEAQKRMAETIPVDQAVRELGIDATPEELLAEVRAQRAARAGGKPAPGPATPPASQAPFTKESFETFIRQFVKESGLDALPDEIIAYLRARRLARVSPVATAQVDSATTLPARRRRWRGPGIGIGTFLFFAWWTGGFQHAPTFTVTPSSGTPITRPLSEIPENHPVTSDTANLEKIIEGKPANTISVIDNEDIHASEWTVVKQSGHYVVRAYLPARVSPTVLKAAPLELYNAEHDTPGNDSVKVTVRLNDLKVASSSEQGLDSTISLSNVHPEDVTYDDWDN